MKNFKQLGQVTINRTDWPSDDSPLWGETAWRQDSSDSPHKDTQTIYYRMPEGPMTREKVFREIYAEWGEGVPEVVLGLVFDLVMQQQWINIGRVMLVKLEKGGVISSHIDEGDYADYYNQRVHIVIQAENASYIKCGEEVRHLGVGEIWAFDHKQMHSAGNWGQTLRIHLIVDGRKEAEKENNHA